LTEDVCNAVYQLSGYEQSIDNMRRTPLSRDAVFADGVQQQMAKVDGSVANGLRASLVVGL
jgi:hypothetical protein